HQYRDLEVEYEGFLFQYNYARADIDHYQSYEDVQSVQNFQNNIETLEDF
ncbi:1689_t:CDS:1, partial [Funneliformis caledonium]